MLERTIAAAILADKDLSVSHRDAEEIAECVRRMAKKQPVTMDVEGKHRSQHWPTRCFGLSCKIGRMADLLGEAMRAQWPPPPEWYEAVAEEIADV